jgi:hypothetical protein
MASADINSLKVTDSSIRVKWKSNIDTHGTTVHVFDVVVLLQLILQLQQPIQLKLSDIFNTRLITSCTIRHHITCYESHVLCQADGPADFPPYRPPDGPALCPTYCVRRTYYGYTPDTSPDTGHNPERNTGPSAGRSGGRYHRVNTTFHTILHQPSSANLITAEVPH